MGCTSSTQQPVGCASSEGVSVHSFHSVRKAHSVSLPRMKIADSITMIEHHESIDRASAQKCYFGAGCYWGTEKFMKGKFAHKTQHRGTIISAEVGFMGPTWALADPTYLEVCSGTTGHVEVLEVWYTGGDAYFEAMVRYFFQFHDPTTLNAQCNDHGTQYASTIFCDTEEQVAIAERVKWELQDLVAQGEVVGFNGTTVTTRIARCTTFYPAHHEHQEYLFKNPNGFCNHRLRFVNWS